MDLPILIQYGFLYGLLLSVLLSIVLLGAMAVNVEVMQNDYPPDVKKAYGPGKNPKTRGQKWIFNLLFMAALFGVIAWSVVSAARVSSTQLTFLPLFVIIFIEVFTFNVWDLLILDWLIFVTLQPKFIFLPGTEGMAGYKDYYFHFKGFLTGTVFSLVGALVLAGIALIVIVAVQ